MGEGRPAAGRHRPLRGICPHDGRPQRRTGLGHPVLSSAVLADHVERQLDELGWETSHIVGNSLGGWVAFELERRGRARSVTGIAPAGGWTRWSPVKFEVIAKFIAGAPILAVAHILGQRALRLPFSRCWPPCDAHTERRERARAVRHHRRRRALPGLFSAAGQGAGAARAAGVGTHRRALARGAVRAGPGGPSQQVQPSFHRLTAGGPPAHRARRRRSRSDVRGSGAHH
ncbi:hypothetical protein J113_23315 [Mycobacterium tuberculosis CAS/NITR204]|uniref:AB hydrolase-1 domain-containing protein n=1 Tax=Mycobacterium tuberculosis CAS/NITR204 TaxID=1310114 RepID=R4MMS5_MYCTX|nr:hypothetical protein J113_23315 [Mycobacterium tuberculosis CAS/NITR204]